MKKILLIIMLYGFQSVMGQCWQAVAGGNNKINALKTDGTLWSWGSNCCYETSDGTALSKLSPTQMGIAADWVSISGTNVNSLGTKSDRSLWTWGTWNGNSNVPTQVGIGNDWLMGFAGQSRYFAIKTDGTLWGWGSNQAGELGDGTTVYRPNPVQIGTDNTWITISTTEETTIGLKSDGTIWVWGHESYGEFGNGEPAGSQSLTPIQVGSETNWELVQSGTRNILAKKNDGTLWAWGRNNTGQLGDGTNTNRAAPVQVGTSSDWESISSGYFFNYARKLDGTLWAWGSNYSGQLCNNTTIDINLPYQVTSVTDVESYYATAYNVLFIKTDNSLWAGGTNIWGQLGNNTSSSNPGTYPTEVSCTILNMNEVISHTAVEIYPNPATDFFHLDRGDSELITSVEIIDLTGKIVSKNLQHLPRFDIRDLRAGVYLVKITVNDKVILKKLVKH